MRPGVVRSALCGGALALLAGCGISGDQAALYRSEKALYEARKAEASLRLAGARPDSAELMKVRAKYLAVRKGAPGPYRVPDAGPGREAALSLIRVVASAETQGARLALMAQRPDLTLEAARWLQQEASADTMSARQAYFMTIAALQGMRRFDDAAKEMKEMLRRYAPAPPSAPGAEDPILALPEAIVSLKRNLGDEEGAKRELREAQTYYQSLLERQAPPELETQIRARLLRTTIELDQPGRALEQAATLERLVAGTPGLRPLLGEVLFAKGKIRASIERDPSEGIAILERVATDFPGSPIAPRALFEAGAAVEAKGNFAGAIERYKSVLQRFPEAPEIAPLTMYRLGISQDRNGDWNTAKRTFEAIPVRYPRSQAAADAPLAVIQHYMREGQRTNAERYLPRAVDIYRDLISRDSTGQWATVFRFRMFQIAMLQKDSTSVYAMADQMLDRDSRHPYTAQVLLQSARLANEYGNSSRAVAYLRRFIKDYPQSPLLGDVRRELKEHGG